MPDKDKQPKTNEIKGQEKKRVDSTKTKPKPSAPGETKAEEKPAPKPKSAPARPNILKPLIAAVVSIALVLGTAFFVFGLFSMTSARWAPKPKDIPMSEPSQALWQQMTSEKVANKTLGVPKSLQVETGFKTIEETK